MITEPETPKSFTEQVQVYKSDHKWMGEKKRKPEIKSLPLRSLYNTEFQNTRQTLMFRVLSNKINKINN